MQTYPYVYVCMHILCYCSIVSSQILNFFVTFIQAQTLDYNFMILVGIFFKESNKLLFHIHLRKRRLKKNKRHWLSAHFFNSNSKIRVSLIRDNIGNYCSIAFTWVFTKIMKTYKAQIYVFHFNYTIHISQWFLLWHNCTWHKQFFVVVGVPGHVDALNNSLDQLKQ